MTSIKSLIFILLFWINTFILSSIIVLVRPFGLKVSYKVGYTWSRINLFLLKLICGVSYEIRIIGELPSSPSVFLSNHQSALETIAFPSFLPQFMWVLKRELFYIPFFGWCLMALGHIGIDRKSGSNAIKKMNVEGKKILNKSYNLVIFPEGTRMPPGQLGIFNPGGVGLAIKNKVPIVPVTHNMGKIWEKRSFRKNPGKITVVIDEPIYTEKISPSERKDINNRVRNIIAKRLVEIDG